MEKEFRTREDAEAWMTLQVDNDCVDNERFAFLDDVEAMKKYQEAEENGCCGFFDEEVLVGGRKAMVGCNYGH